MFEQVLKKKQRGDSKPKGNIPLSKNKKKLELPYNNFSENNKKIQEKLKRNFEKVWEKVCFRVTLGHNALIP